MYLLRMYEIYQSLSKRTLYIKDMIYYNRKYEIPNKIKHILHNDGCNLYMANQTSRFTINSLLFKRTIHSSCLKNAIFPVRKRWTCFPEKNLLRKRLFHSSNPNKALPPLVWIIVRSLLRIAAIFTGRGLRKWWARLPKYRKDNILRKVSKNRNRIGVGGALSGSAVYIYYLMHLVEDPITKRKRFLIFSDKQIMQMAVIECEVVMERYKGQLVQSGYHYNNVLNITNKILNANKHIPGTDRQWQVIIVNDIETKNAFVLPSGHIFIFTGMLAVVSNQDQMAAVIGHEMAHALLSHSAEIASKTHLLEMLMLIPVIAIWSLFPDLVALFSHQVTKYLSAILFQLPFSRSLESEADVVGLEMIARACYDPKQASLFWRKMESFAEDDQVEWLSTHPSHHSRYQTLDELMPGALKIVTEYCTKRNVNPHLSRYYPGPG